MHGFVYITFHSHIVLSVLWTLLGHLVATS